MHLFPTAKHCKGFVTHCICQLHTNPFWHLLGYSNHLSSLPSWLAHPTSHPCLLTLPLAQLTHHPYSPTSCPSSPTYVPFFPTHLSSSQPTFHIPTLVPTHCLALLSYLIPVLIPAHLSLVHTHCLIPTQLYHPAHLYSHSHPHPLSCLELNLDTICEWKVRLEGVWLCGWYKIWLSLWGSGGRLPMFHNDTHCRQGTKVICWSNITLSFYRDSGGGSAVI